MLIAHFRITFSCDVKRSSEIQNGYKTSIKSIFSFAEIFSFSATMNVSHEIELLVEEIKRLGSKSKSTR